MHNFFSFQQPIYHNSIMEHYWPQYGTLESSNDTIYSYSSLCEKKHEHIAPVSGGGQLAQPSKRKHFSEV